MRFHQPKGARRGRSGFTLIEMLAVMIVTSIVLVFVVNFYIEISRTSTEAVASTRELRRATAILDRVARDLESTVLLVKPDEEDPLTHPWLFLAEGGGGEAGAERVKFVSRGRISRSTAVHDSDLEQVAYFLADAEDGSVDLVRWTTPRLGESLDRSFPDRDDEAALVLAHHVAAFGVRLLDEAGEWIEEWDSAGIVRSSQLPIAAEISVAVYPDAGLEEDLEEEEPELFARRVELPVRPIDLTELLAEEPGDDEEDEGDETSMTVGECAAKLQQEIPPNLQALIDENADAPLADVVDQFVAAGVTLEDCL
jgi:prepilin-type N-terminal cleavage/methylation domain-containing protein